MQIIGFNFEKIQAERKIVPKGKIQISSNINMKTITQEKVDLLKDQSPIKFTFEFSVKYAPDVADLTFIGSVLVLLDKEKTKEVIKKWKDKKIVEDIRVPLFNFIFSKCNLKALQFEEEFSLPAHIPMPQIRQENPENAKYTG